MSLLKTEAVVLKSQKLGETSKLVSLFSKKFGKIKVVAKGARGNKSHFYGTLDPVNYISIVFYHKENRDLQLISHAEINESYDKIKQDLHKLTLALLGCEMLLRSQDDNEAHPNLFNLIIAYLKKLNEAHERFENFFFWYQLKFLSLNGFKPALWNCVQCRRPMERSQQKYFSDAHGGCLCGNCIPTSANGFLISDDSLHFLQAIERNELEHIISIENSVSIIDESLTVLKKFMEYHIDGLKNLKSFKFLHDVQ